MIKELSKCLFFKLFFHVQNLPGLAWGEGHGEGDSGIEKMLLTHSYFIILFLAVQDSSIGDLITE